MISKTKKPASKKGSKGQKKGKSFKEGLRNFSVVMTEWLGSNMSLLLHTIFFAGSFGLVYFGISMDRVLLVLTTAVSLEAIYMAIFIQMAVNKNTKSLREVEKDIDEIQEDVEEIQEDVEEIQEDVDLIEKDVDELQEDVEEISQEDDDKQDEINQKKLSELSDQLQAIIAQLKHISGEHAESAKKDSVKKNNS